MFLAHETCMWICIRMNKILSNGYKILCIDLLEWFSAPVLQNNENGRVRWKKYNIGGIKSNGRRYQNIIASIIKIVSWEKVCLVLPNVCFRKLYTLINTGIRKYRFDKPLICVLCMHILWYNICHYWIQY